MALEAADADDAAGGAAAVFALWDALCNACCFPRELAAAKTANAFASTRNQKTRGPNMRVSTNTVSRELRHVGCTAGDGAAVVSISMAAGAQAIFCSQYLKPFARKWTKMDKRMYAKEAALSVGPDATLGSPRHIAHPECAAPLPPEPSCYDF